MSRLVHARSCRAIRTARVWAPMLLSWILMAPLAGAESAPGHDRAPQAFNVAACYRLVQHEGRMVAWARWEQGFSLEQMRSGQFGASTPPWIVDMVQAWILDAYAWHATDEQVREWAQELGNTKDLPSTSQLTVHETIAIWMRRMGQQCETVAQASAQESLVVRLKRPSGEVSGPPLP